MKYTIELEVTDDELNGIINQLNKEIDPDEGETPLTLDEVKNNQPLLDFLLKGALDPIGLYDPSDCWNMDGWAGYEQFR